MNVRTFRTLPMHVSRHFALAAAYGAALFGSAALALLAGCGGPAQAAVRTGAVGGPATADPRLHFYKESVQPVLQANCYRCHAGMNRRGGLDMSTRERLLQGGKDGPVVLPGRPEDSQLVRSISPGLPEGDPLRMPPKGTRLTAEQVAAIRRWVADGAMMDK